MEKLLEYRKEIESIDSQLIELLVQRMELSRKIGQYKKENGLAIFDPKREEELKEKNILSVKEEYRRSYQEIFENILHFLYNYILC